MDMVGQQNSSGNAQAGDETSKTNRTKNTPALDQKVQDAIGQSLKAHYDDLVKAPVPDKLLALLAELEAREASRDS
jgi:hypothetical protein